MAVADDLIQQTADIQRKVEQERSLTLCVLAQKYVDGKLTDPTKLAAELERIHRTLKEFQVEVDNRRQLELLRPQLRDEEKLSKEQASVEKERTALIAKFETQRKTFNENLNELENRASQIASQWSQHREAAHKITELLSAERAAVDELDRQLAEKRQRREELRGRTGNSQWWRVWSTGERHSSHSSRVKELEHDISVAEDTIRKTNHPDQIAKAKATVASCRAGIELIQKKAAADRKSLADLEGEIATLQAQRDSLRDSLLRG